MKIFTGIIGAFILAIFGVFLAAFVFTNYNKDSVMNIAFIVSFTIGILITIKSESTAKVWRRFFLSYSVISFLTPIVAIIFSGTYMATEIDVNNRVEVVGAAIGGGIFTGITGFVGFFLGIVFLIIGLLIGRDKQIIYVEKQ